MIKSAKYSYGGMNQDITKSKHTPELYFNAQHIRVITEDSQTTGSVTNEKGTREVFRIPNDISVNTVSKTINYNNKSLDYNNIEIDNLNITNNHIIIGHVTTKDSIILITTSEGTDCIWIVKNIYTEDYDIELLYIRNMEMSVNNPIQILYNFENEINEKIYWVDGKNQLRFINLKHSIENGDKENLIDLDVDLVNTVGDIQLSQPIFNGYTSGGTHTSGVIQYSYNLYKTNLSQTKLSPLTNLIPLSKNSGTEGGDVNEVVGSTPIIKIDNIDLSYTNIKVYALKYNSINEIPKISIIADRQIPESGELIIYDDGNSISDISIDELTFLGSDPIIPKHIESKDNQLFQFNIKESFYELKDFDSRAFSFDSLGNSKVWQSGGNTINGLPSFPFTNINVNYNISKTHDCINPNYDIYKYQRNGNIIGGEGKYLKYQLLEDPNYNENDQYFKSREIYRLSAEFYNNKGQKTLPHWIADIQAPDNNLNNIYNKLSVTLKPEFYTYINTLDEKDRPVGYRILRADRTEIDRTILCQGIINPMIANKIFKSKHSYGYMLSNPETLYDQQIIKYPSLIRTFENTVPMLRNIHNMPLANLNENTGDNALTDSPLSEGFKAASSDDFRGQLFQFNTMMQMYTPEILFSNVRPDRTHKLRVKGIMEQSDRQAEMTEVNIATQLPGNSGKIENGIYPHDPNAIVISTEGNVRIAARDGIFAPPATDSVANYYQFYREFKGVYQAGTNREYNIYGAPEVQVLGQGVKAYNNDSNFRYSNNYSTILQDSGQDSRDRNNPVGRGLNSNGISAITFVEGLDTLNYPVLNRLSIENIYNQNNFTITNGVMISEMVKPNEYKYFGNIYGGNNYEAKLRTSYIPIGNFEQINNSVNIINSPGDTFVNDFVFTKVSKVDKTIASPGVNQITEIVSFKVETSVDLKNRNDNSLFEWDSEFQPTYNSFQRYNRIYSQKENIFKTRNVDFNFKDVINFGNTIFASKKKIAGELIDSWTDLLINETMDLDGKYGSINGTINYNDQIFTFQDKAIAAISINPRVQTQASDGLSLELGTGSTLQDYQYITTMSGSVNKWGIIQGMKGVYYYDTLNKGLFRINDAVSISLSDIKGMRNYFNNSDYDSLILDNPVLNNGVNLGYDNYNKEIYVTLHGKDSKTILFNEKLDEFIDTKLYYPSRYIDSSYKFFGTENNLSIHKHHEGIYNEYYDKNIKSFITLMLNPQPDLDCIFNNIIFKSELSIDGVEINDQTITDIRSYNEYQDSGVVQLVNRQNIARKFRDWKAFIPRDGRDRIRNPWTFLELGFENPNNKKLVLHDLNILYTI